MWAYASEVMLGMTETAAASGDPKAEEMLRSHEEDAEKGDNVDDNDGDVDDEDNEEIIPEDDDDSRDDDGKSTDDRTVRVEL